MQGNCIIINAIVPFLVDNRCFFQDAFECFEYIMLSHLDEVLESFLHVSVAKLKNSLKESQDLVDNSLVRMREKGQDL